MSSQVSRREFLRVLGTGAAGAVLVACQPKTVIVKETVEVEKEVEKVVKETVVVEKEKEVTKVVEKFVEKVVTPTPISSTFKQAPMLAELEAAGTLDPLDERLGAEPNVWVRDGFDQEIGRYGGRDLVTPTAISHQGYEYMLMLNRDCTQTIPNVAKSWEYSEDALSITLYLRRGMKWSDGAPLTADDLLFWWEALVLNDEATPVKPAIWKPGGELMEWVKLDDFTVRIKFAAPFWYMHHKIDGTFWGGSQQGGAEDGFYGPKHYLKQFHIDYNPDADQLATEANFEHWYQLFLNKAATNPIPIDVPTVAAWLRIEEAATGNTWERNPYNWKVDPDGNQLPYIDRVIQPVRGDREAHLMKMIAGENDYEAWGIAVQDWPVLKQNEDKGGYDLWMAGDCWVSYACYFPNENYDADPELGELLRDKRFRQALSLAMDRDEINEKTALGQGTSIQATCNWACPWYKEEWGTAYAGYDPDQANRILDDIGLDNRDSEGFRTKPSGEKLDVIIECTTAIPYWVPVTELVKAHWDAVGIRTIMKVDEWDLLFARLGAGEIQIFTWYTGHMPFTLLARKAHVPREMSRWAPKWWAWVDSGGEEGEEPPDDVKRLYELGELVAVTPPDEVNAVMQEFYDDQAESLRIIGTIGYIGKPAISNKQLGNVDQESYGDNSDTGGTRNNWLDLLYWKEA